MAKPFLKWVGGKRQLLPFLIPRMPKRYYHYYEPFAGGGALFFSVKPHSATLSDICHPLMVTYRQIQGNPHRVLEELHQLNDTLVLQGAKFYYFVRDEFNRKLREGTSDAAMAAMMIFLNRHTFNGLWRVNQKGEFNAPFNGSFHEGFHNADILEASRALQNVKLKEKDFGFVESEAKAGDFVFFDSPYAPLDGGSFTAYDAAGFQEKDHIRLARLFQTLAERGVYCLATNHNTAFVRELYGDFQMTVVPAKRMINCKGDRRTGEEVIIQSY